MQTQIKPGQLVKKSRQEVKVRVNIKAFRLAGWVTEDSPWLDKVREFVKTGNQKLLRALKAEGVVLGYQAKHNLVCTRGRESIARRISGDTTYSGAINYGALGSGSTAPANADVQLQTEVYRKIYSSRTFSDNIAYVDFFYAATDTNGTYNEFGNFIDGTGTANSGRLFSRITTGGWVKSSVESLFVSCQYTFN